MRDYGAPALKHGGLGIASFLTALTALFIAFLDFVVAQYLGAIHEGSRASATFEGAVLILCMFLSLIAIGLGAAAVRDKEFKRVFAVWGLSIALGTILLFGAIVAFGLAGGVTVA